MKLSKFVLSTCAVMALSSAAFAEKGAVYISPNNDGVQDQLEVPLQIKEKRYISEWNFIIYDARGNVVRTIGNKEKRPDKVTVGSFFSQLFAPKEGVEVPEFVVWNGYFDDGSLAPDGTYYYQFSATDDNGNTATTSKLEVIVDNTAPTVQLTQPSEAEKIFGEGAKSVLRIVQTGSSETVWTAQILDNESNVKKTFKWSKSAPLSLNWDGTDDEGSLVPDGVYSYRVFSTDEAGNTSDTAQITNIIYSAEKPSVAISILGSKYFSPNGNGIQDTVNLLLSIAQPDSKTNSLVQWTLDIVRASDSKVVRTYSGTSNPPSSLDYDGTDATGAKLAEGEYFAQVNAKYLNGYDSGKIKSPVFVLDLSVPKVTVTASDKTFSPDGDGSKDVVTITQKLTSSEPEWTGTKDWKGSIIASDGSVVRTFDFGETPAASVVWDGISSTGSLVPDGTYRYELSLSKKSGISASYSTEAFTLDTSKTELMLSVANSAFSKNPASKNQSITFVPFVKASSGIKSYTLTIKNSAGKAVRTISGTGSVPASIIWRGTGDDDSVCDDGIYSAELETIANSGTKSKAVKTNIVLDSDAPQVSLSVPYRTFSPDGKSSRLIVPVTASSSEETKWTGQIVSSGSRPSVVRTYTWYGTVPSFAWDGTDESGNIVSDGTYNLTVSATDDAGNSGSASVTGLVVDTREAKAYVTVDYDAISPNGDGFRDSQKFSLRTSFSDGIDAWNFSILDSKGKAVRTWTNADFASLPSSITWDGLTSDGAKGEGTYTGKLSVSYEKGNSVEAGTVPFICTATAPVLSVKTSPRYFSPDNDGNDDDLNVSLKCESKAKISSWSFVINDPNGREFWRTSGKSSITELLTWDGRGSNGELVQSAMDYPYVFTVTDELGMTSSVEGKINVDVLVIRVGDVLKMQVPSIIFRSDNADFGLEEKDASGRVIKQGITAEQKANNERVLRRIAEILKKFEDYNVTIVGHANRLTDNAQEETVDNPSAWGPALIPLSLRRAQYVQQQLISLGIASSRLSVEGKGGTEPVADTKDRSVNWKNRRVEFILNK